MITYQGQTLVEEDHSFLDSHYVYYVYHGPLVRGLEVEAESRGTPLTEKGT